MVRLAPWDKVLTVVHLFLMGRLLAAQVGQAAAVAALAAVVDKLREELVAQMVVTEFLPPVLVVSVKAPPLVNLVKQALRYILVEEAVAQEVATLVMAALVAVVEEIPALQV